MKDNKGDWSEQVRRSEVENLEKRRIPEKGAYISFIYLAQIAKNLWCKIKRGKNIHSDE